MTGRGRKKDRNVVGVLCPTVLAQSMGSSHPPVFVLCGDVAVDWSAEPSEGYRDIAAFDRPWR